MAKTTLLPDPACLHLKLLDASEEPQARPLSRCHSQGCTRG
ncbi:MAG TPA: hypothetical protein VFB12_06465 [Ktedonobacteraceae bacterium]|nr:hypothetical protein [Ktedonobacteraceae bacterium]